MEQEKIRELLSKYFDGTTTEEEEAQLGVYLSDPSVSSFVRSEYGYLPGIVPEIPEPSNDFYEKLSEMTFRNSETTFRRRVLRNSRIAAAAAAILTGAWLIFNFTGRPETRDTYKDPVVAMAEVRNILLAVSEKMTTGTGALGPINSLNTAPETLSGLKIINKVNDDLSKLHYLDQLSGSDNKTENQ
ncbi:MAG: hypothetical protein WAV93_08570 [Bacteroidales bacterium]